MQALQIHKPDRGQLQIYQQSLTGMIVAISQQSIDSLLAVIDTNDLRAQSVPVGNDQRGSQQRARWQRELRHKHRKVQNVQSKDGI